MKMKMMALAVMAAFSRGAGLTLGAVALEIDKDAHAKLPKDVQALYVEKDGKFRLDGVDAGDELKVALGKEREARKTAEKAAKDLAARFEGIDPDAVRSLLDKMGGDEEAALLKAGKFDEAFNKRTEKLRQAHAKELEKAAKSATDSKALADKRAALVLDNFVRQAAAKAALHPNAVEDALFRARTIFRLSDDDSSPVQVDSDGKVVMGKDGKTPFTPSEWLDGMRESAPHWFPANNSGGGATGGNKSGGKATMKRADFDRLGPSEKAAKAKEMQKGELTVVD